MSLFCGLICESIPTLVYTVTQQYCIEQTALEYENIKALMVLIDWYTELRIGELCGLFQSYLGTMKEYFNVKRLIELLKIEWTDHHPDYKRIPITNTKEGCNTALYFRVPKTESDK